jgi:4-amino-4-deoxy-L-arabinose transferase-like glycosyltransferase
MPPDGIIEPPILEIVSSLAYFAVGGEHLWIPRLLSVLFWMVGGVFLYLIAKRMVSPNAAVFPLLFYLFVPYSVPASRAIMPDPLMIMLLLASILTILRYHEQPSTRRLIIAAITSSLAIFVKPGICLFQIFGAFVSLAVYRQGVRRSLTDPHSLVFAVLSVLPTGLYYLYGTLIAGFLRGQAAHKIAPRLLLEASFWEGWLGMIGLVVGYVALLAALLGVLLLRNGLPRALMIGLWSGYFLFGLTFTTHITTSNYYSLQLIPVVALSLGSIAELVIKHLVQVANNLGQLGWRGFGKIAVLALSILILVLSAVGGTRMFTYSITAMRAREEGFVSYVATFKKIGEVVNHSRRTLILFGGPPSRGVNYGFALMYYGRLSGKTWPWPHVGEPQEGSRPAAAQELFSRRYSNRKRSPEYFVISRGWWNRVEIKALRTFLTKNYPMVAQGDRYVVFDLRRNLNSQERNLGSGEESR